jgi:hypothetical protein
LVGFGMGKVAAFVAAFFVVGSNGVEQATTNTGILHFVQDDDFEGGAIRMTTSWASVQDDDFVGERFRRNVVGRATAKTKNLKQARTRNKQRRKATANAGILHCVQDDDFVGGTFRMRTS